jgi:hypothetical protein
MEAAMTSETLINVYQITRRYNPEDRHIRTHCLENLRIDIKQHCLLQTLLSISKALSLGVKAIAV